MTNTTAPLPPRGVMSRTERLPRDFSSLDAAWMTRFLTPRWPGVLVETMEIVQFIDGHTTKARVLLSLNDAGKAAGLPDRMCLKGNWTAEERSSAVCVDEARFYNDLPAFLSVPSPRCFMADWDDDALGQQGIIALEDLVPLGGVFSSTASGLSVDDAHKAVVGLAALHGSSWGRPELDELHWLQTSVAADNPIDDYWMLLKDVIDVRKLDPEWTSILPEWMQQSPDMLYACFQQMCTEEREDSSPLCLIHGDAHLGNSYRLPDGNRLWFDWQLPRRGRCWRDVTYFIIGSLEVEDRRAHLRSIFDHYLDELGKHGVVLDGHRAWRDFRRWIVWGLIAWITNINPNEPSAPVLDRFSRAAEDLDMRSLYSV